MVTLATAPGEFRERSSAQPAPTGAAGRIAIFSNLRSLSPSGDQASIVWGGGGAYLDEPRRKSDLFTMIGAMAIRLSFVSPRKIERYGRFRSSAPSRSAMFSGQPRLARAGEFSRIRHDGGGSGVRRPCRSMAAVEVD